MVELRKLFLAKSLPLKLNMYPIEGPTRQSSVLCLALDLRSMKCTRSFSDIPCAQAMAKEIPRNLDLLFLKIFFK